MKKILRISFLLFANLSADIVVMAGYGQIGIGSDAPIYPIVDTFDLGETSASSVGSFSNVQALFNGLSMDPYRGTVLYFGAFTDSLYPALYRGSVVSSQISSISVPHSLGGGEFRMAAFDSNGNAVLVGDANPNFLACRLAFGATQVASVALPTTDPIDLNAVAIGNANRAILGGQNGNTSAPVAYALLEGADEAIAITLTNAPSNGIINAIAMSPNGTAILAGADYTNNQALIYQLASGSTTAEPIAIPAMDMGNGGAINDVAIASDGTVILVGSAFTRSNSPLIYQFSPNTPISTVTNPNENPGALNTVAIGPNNTAVIGGDYASTFLPLLWMLPPAGSTALAIALPNGNQGTIYSLAINSENVAVIGGEYFNSNAPLLLTLGPTSTMATAISAPGTLNEELLSGIAIYTSDGSYDIHRLRAYYYLNLTNSLVGLGASGL